MSITLAAQNESLLRYLSDDPPHQSLADMATALGRDRSNLRKSIDKLCESSLIEPIDHASGVIGYRITPSAAQQLQGLDVAAGRQIQPKSAHPGAIMLRHDQIIANPLNPRREFDILDVNRLADTIISAGTLLQNLTVYPPDEHGIHILGDGERRWRAIGQLIDSGEWPSDRLIPCTLRQDDPALVAFLALVANSGVALTQLEEAEAFLAIATDMGWSAAETARKTGRHIRVVQEYIKVAREAHSNAKDEFRAGYRTWEGLRDSVKISPPAPARQAADTPETTETVDTANTEEIDTTHIPVLSPKIALALVELASAINITAQSRPSPMPAYTPIAWPITDYAMQSLIEMGWVQVRPWMTDYYAIIMMMTSPAGKWLRANGWDDDPIDLRRRSVTAVYGDDTPPHVVDGLEYATADLNIVIDTPQHAAADTPTTPADAPPTSSPTSFTPPHPAILGRRIEWLNTDPTTETAPQSHADVWPMSEKILIANAARAAIHRQVSSRVDTDASTGVWLDTETDDDIIARYIARLQQSDIVGMIAAHVELIASTDDADPMQKLRAAMISATAQSDRPEAADIAHDHLDAVADTAP